MQNSYCPVCFTWGGLVTKFYKQYCRSLEISAETEAYIQIIALKKTLELISLDRRRGIEEEDKNLWLKKALRV
ncbi:hypothetical protein COBT_000641 [Conglomerata obtusa]